MHNQTIIFLGLYHQNVDLEWLAQRQKCGDQIWTMNDFYMFYPFLMPDRIFQVHRPESLPIGRDFRWAGDYKLAYNSCNCPVVQCYLDRGINNQELLPTAYLKRFFPLHWYQITVVYMLAQVLDFGYMNVELQGMKFLADGEREHQLPFLLKAMDAVREKGIHIEVDPELETEWRCVAPLINWGLAHDMQPYHVRDSGAVPKYLIDKPGQLDNIDQ